MAGAVHLLIMQLHPPNSAPHDICHSDNSSPNSTISASAAPIQACTVLLAM